MRKILFSLLLFSCGQIFPQAGRPYAIWEDPIAGGYKYVQLNAATGGKTNIAGVPGILGFIMGSISCMDEANNYYHFAAVGGAGSNMLYTLNASTGAVISSPVMPDNVIGVEYNCTDSKLYALREISDYYDIVTIDPVTAVSTTIAPIGFLNGYVGSSFCLNTTAGHYSFVALLGTNFYLKTYDINTGLLVASSAFPDNVTGLKYSCLDNAVYGLWDNGGGYKLEKVDQSTGIHTTMGVLSGVMPGFVGESQSVDENGYYTFRGFNMSGNFSLFTVDLSTVTVTASATTTDNAVGFEEFSCCSLPTGITASAAQNTFSVFPVPVSEELNVSAENAIDWIEIFSMNGKKNFDLNGLSEKNFQINVSGWTRGLYLIRVGTNNGSSTQKIVLD